MFLFNKLKKKSKSAAKAETSEEKAMRDTALDKVLLGYHINHHSIAKMITAIKREGQVVTLNVTLPETVDAEKVHRELSQQLQPHGIYELNLNVRIKQSSENPKIPISPQDKTLATNAMPTPTQPPTNQEPTMQKTAPKQSELSPHPRINHIIVVASGKGGVGKSTTTVNIALALQKLGNKVGVLDADIYGPSMPDMLGVAGTKPMLENEQFVPIDAHGMPMLSIGSLLDSENTPIAWRGPKATGALMQLYHQTNWPNLDYLVIDMPPGTGDIQLTLAQRIPVTAAIIVTTPQHIALLDAKKGIEMFHKTQIPVLGIVENMALHTCSQCGHTEAIFGSGGGEQISQQYQVPLLGQLPLAQGIREQADKGVPSVLADDDFAKFYLQIAKNIEENITKYAKKHDDGRIF